MYSRIKRALLHALQTEAKIESGLYRYLSDRTTTEKICERLETMPVSNGNAYYKKINKNVGIIADEFIYMVYKDCCNLVYLTPANWEEALGTLDIVIIVSTWHGLKNEWDAIHIQGSFANYQIEKLKEEARKQDIPVVFYSKEDPPNYAIFLSLAKNVDVIFTSAEECIEQYKTEYPATPCFCLNFAINPMLHNPIGLCDDMFENTLVFAGSWMKKYPIRTAEQRQIFEYIQKAGLDLTIIDRNYERNNRNYFYPLKYVSNVVTSFSYEEIAKIYKMFPYVLNLNSVNQSNTMFASRVYEASACGAILLSNPSKGMEELFSEVKVVRGISDVEEIIGMSETEMLAKRVRTIRDVFRKNTAYENMTYILRCAGVFNDEIELPEIGVVMSEECKFSEKLQKLFYMQSYQNKRLLKEKELAVGIEKNNYLAFWTDKYEYDEFYLEDMMNAFKYTDSEFVVKGKNKQKSHVYVEQADDKYQAVFHCKTKQQIVGQSNYCNGKGYRI